MNLLRAPDFSGALFHAGGVFDSARRARYNG